MDINLILFYEFDFIRLLIFIKDPLCKLICKPQTFIEK